MDLVERLRAWERGACMRPLLYDEAADEIERLRAELTRSFDLDNHNAIVRMLHGQIDALKADAERYRWVRPRLEARTEKMMDGNSRLCLNVRIGCAVFGAPLPVGFPPGAREERMTNLDAAIDAAREG